MPERSSAIPAWAWIVGAVLAIVSIFAGYRLVQTQQHLVAAQSELESAKQAVEKANAERNELQSKLEDATSEVRSAQSVLAETKSVLEAAQSELERATQAAEKANRQKRKSRSSSKRRPVSTQSFKRRMGSALTSRRNWMRPERRLSDLKVSSKKRRAPKVLEAAVEISASGTKRTFTTVVTKSASGPKRTNRPFSRRPNRD